MSESTRATVAEPQAKTEAPRSETKKSEERSQSTGFEAQILHRQKTIGNRAVQRLIKSGSLHVPLKAPSPAARKSPQPVADISLGVIDRQAAEVNSPTALTSGPPEFQVPPATGPAAPASPASQKQEIRSTQSAGPTRIDRHWYNISIPFTDYEFDPSIEGVKTAAGLVKDAAVSAFDWIVDKIKGLVSDAWDWLTKEWDKLKNLIASAMNAVESALGKIVSFFLSPLSALADAIMSLDSQAVDKAWKVLSGIVSSVSNGFKATIDAVLSPIKAVWSLIGESVGSTIDAISSLFHKLPGVLQKIAKPFVDKITALWKTVNDWWTENFNKLKSWAESAVDKVFSFVRRILSFGINVVVQSILQFGQLVRFLKDFYNNPQKYIAILVQKSVKAFDGVENKFAGLIHQYFGSSSKAQTAGASATRVQRQPEAAAPAEAKTSATWSEIGDGVWEMMKKKWNEFKSNPLSIITGLLMDMFLPIVGNIKDIIKLFQDIKKIVTGPMSAGSLEELWTSILQILDIPILIYQTVVSILMRTLMLPLIVATFVPHPLVKAIAAAVGEALLAAFVESEVLNIGHKLVLLRTGATVKSQKEEAYNRVADSLIAMAMTAVIVIIILILNFIANVMKGIYNFVKGKVMRVEAPAVEGRGSGEGKGKGEDIKPADTKGEGLPSEDGKRKIKIDQNGKCEVCASPCDDIRKRYGPVIGPGDETKIKAIEDNGALSDAQKEVELRPIEQELADRFRQRLLGNPKVADAAQANRLLTNAKVTDGAQLERMLANAKVADATQLERMLGNAKVADAGQLERLLGHATVTDAAQVERLLASPRVADATQLERMLAHLNDATDLERFLANGNPIWEGTTGPAPAEATAAADYAAANGGAAQPGYAGNRAYGNNGLTTNDMILPRKDGIGNPITYKEYDIHPRTPGVNRGAERVVIGSDGRRYYTSDHYRSFTQF